MIISEFIENYREAFGDAAPLPIAVAYGITPATDVRYVPKCMIGAISKVRNGEALTLSADNVLCGGGGLYTAFRPMPERVPVFVSEVEHYKKTKEMVIDYVDSLKISLTDKPYLNFVRVDKLESWDDAEALIFFATPDMLSGHCTWAFYDNNDPDAVTTLFASGCASIITFAVNENRSCGRRCFLGMLDPSARPLVPANELTLTIPMSRFKEFDVQHLFVEVEEFDCLHDEGVMIYEALSPSCGHSVLLDNKGTFHGYDINFKADITQESLQQRIRFLSESFPISF